MCAMRTQKLLGPWIFGPFDFEKIETVKFHASTAILNDIGIGKSPKCLVFWKDRDQRSIDRFAPNSGLPERRFRGT